MTFEDEEAEKSLGKNVNIYGGCAGKGMETTMVWRVNRAQLRKDGGLEQIQEVLSSENAHEEVET